MNFGSNMFGGDLNEVLNEKRQFDNIEFLTNKY